MLKFSLLLEEEEEKQPVNGFEKKIIATLERKFDEFSVDQIYYEYDVGEHIMSYLKDVMVLPFHKALEIYYLYNNNLSQIRRGEEEWLQNPKRGYELIDSTEPTKMALAEHLNTPPNFLLKEDGQYYGMDHYFDQTDGHLYAIGTEEEVEKACEDYAENLMWGLEDTSPIDKFHHSELNSLYGWDIIVRNIYIPEELRKTIAREDAENYIEDWGDDDEEVLNTVAQQRPDIDSEWEKIEQGIYQLEEKMGGSDDTDIEMKIKELKVLRGELAEQARQLIFDEEFESSYERTKDTLEWLEEFEYVEKKNGRWSPTYVENQYSDGYNYKVKTSLPKWIKIDVKSINKELIERVSTYRGEEFARYDGHERSTDYNGEYFYIYKTD